MKPTTPRTKILFIGSLSGFASREILRGVLSMRTNKHHWDILSIAPEITLEELSTLLSNTKFHGIIARNLQPEIARAIKDWEIPSVFIRAREDESASYINGPTVDDSAIGKLAGEEFSLLNLGYWGFIHWQGVMWSDARRKSFHSYATERAVSNSTLSLPKDIRHSWAAVVTIADWLRDIPKPCGILACNDQAGRDVIHAAQLLNLSIPDEIAIIGVDNDRLLCESTSPALSSIDLKVADMGLAAAVHLANLLDTPTEHHTPHAQVIVRESSNRINKSMLTYQKALDYLSARPLMNTRVTELATICGVSRRGLERAFEKSSKIPPAALIRETRMQAIISLLQDKSSSIESIAQQADFSEASGLANFVKRMTGKNPGDFRPQ